MFSQEPRTRSTFPLWHFTRCRSPFLGPSPPLLFSPPVLLRELPLSLSLSPFFFSSRLSFSVCGSTQTGRGGVLGENLLVTTSYQYALTVSSCAPVLVTSSSD